jgi:hypothetical protein
MVLLYNHYTKGAYKNQDVLLPAGRLPRRLLILLIALKLNMRKQHPYPLACPLEAQRKSPHVFSGEPYSFGFAAGGPSLILTSNF